MTPRYKWSIFSLIFILVVVLGYLGYRYNDLNKQFILSKITVENLQKKLTELELEKTNLTSTLQVEQGKNTIFAEQIGQISGQVGTLTKLSQTDKELLQKYSKVYFLNENYTPSQLAIIEKEYLKDKSRNFLIHAQVWSYLKKMLDASADDEVPLLIVSAYRSFFEQYGLKTNYKTVYGTGANTFSADQGYSEHQLGTTVDLATPTSTISTFEKTEAFVWLVKNAHKYGFIMSYPKDNKYYMYEPWHWRFVGVSLANKLKEDDKNFYDLDQREIDTYLVSIFD